MSPYFQALEKLLPEHLRDILEWDFVPWNFIQDRHANLAPAPLTALFQAYLDLNNYLDLEALVSQKIPETSWGCERCGFCCTSMRPGPVTAAIYEVWEQAGIPIAWFYKPAGKWRRNSLYKCWYHNDVHLRICPFVFINRYDSRPFCSIYHMGAQYRPPICSSFHPRHESCGLEVNTGTTPYLGQEYLHED